MTSAELKKAVIEKNASKIDLTESVETWQRSDLVRDVMRPGCWEIQEPV